MRLVVALLCGVLLTCASAGRALAADDPLTVVVGAAPNAFFEVLTNVAEKAGFYKAEHLAVTTNYAGSPNIATQLVASGKADITGQAIEPIFVGAEKGIALQAFFVRDPRFEWVLGVLDSSPIKTLADFKGTTIGELSIGSPGEIVADSTLAGAGVRKSDVSYLPIGTAAQGMSAIVARKVDGAAFPYVALAGYEVQGHLKFRYFWDPILAGIGDTAYAASPATIQTKADQLRRFARANAEAAVLVRENPALAARYFLEGAGIRVTPQALSDETHLLELTQQDLPGSNPESTTIGRMPPVGMAILARFLYDAGATHTIVPVSSVVTDQFIAYANDFDHRALIAKVKAMR